MLILTIRTDKPEAEAGLYEDEQQIAYKKWQAHRELSGTIHTKIEELLKSKEKSLTDIEGIVVFRGPGSFTGLRIGITVANALSDGINTKIVGTNGDKWIDDGIAKLLGGKNEKLVLPDYGREARITTPRK